MMREDFRTTTPQDAADWQRHHDHEADLDRPSLADVVGLDSRHDGPPEPGIFTDALQASFAEMRALRR